jgi:hypothetical protein
VNPVAARLDELGLQQHALQSQLDTLPQPGAQSAHKQAPDLLAQLPLVRTSVSSAPPELQRRLYDAYRLKIRYNRARHAVTLHVTVTADALPPSLPPRTPSRTPPAVTPRQMMLP